MERRRFLALLNAATLVACAPAIGMAAEADDRGAPIGGNPDGDVTAVAFFDYNCPFCKRASPELRAFVASDPGVKLVYRDWPVLGDASVFGARLALAAAYQDRYEAAHLALMALQGRRNLEDRMREAIRATGLDMARLDADLKAHAADIAALLARNDAQARALGLQAVPTILIGSLRVVGGFDLENFQDFAARARAGR